MKTFIISASGLGAHSITHYSMQLLAAMNPQDTFDFLILPKESEIDYAAIMDRLQESDLGVILTSPYHTHVPSHVRDFMLQLGNEIHASAKESKMPAMTAFTTSSHLLDTFLHSSLQMLIKSASFRYLPALSLQDGEILSPDGKARAQKWYLQTKYMLEKIECEPEKPLNLLMVNTQSDGVLTDVLKADVRELKLASTLLKFNYSEIRLCDYNVLPCDGCKFCYHDKVCKFKDADDYEKLEGIVNKADIVIFVGEMSCGMMSGLYKRFLDRQVHHGLMPVSAVSYSTGFLVDSTKDLMDSLNEFKEHCISIASYSKLHFIGISDSASLIGDSIPDMLQLEKAINNFDIESDQNWYSAAISRHFANLALRIPEVIPNEYNYFKSIGAYEPIKEDENARAITSIQACAISQQMRAKPYEMQLEALKNVGKGGNS